MIDLQMGNCLELMKDIPDNSVDMILTDIPYGEVNRNSNGLRNLDKSKADIVTFQLIDFLEQAYRVTKSTIVIFCGKEQLSEIHRYFSQKQKSKRGTIRQLIWKKTNPSPMNGKYIYLSGIENIIWFKKRGGTFHANCKNVVFEYPCGRNKLHPTEKPIKLLTELILDNTNENDTVLDNCMGSGSTGVACINTNRNFIGMEIEKKYFEISVKRIYEAQRTKEGQV